VLSAVLLFSAPFSSASRDSSYSSSRIVLIATRVIAPRYVAPRTRSRRPFVEAFALLPRVVHRHELARVARR
jgi:hypothetical protein